MKTHKKCAPIFDEIKGIQGKLRDHIEIISDFEIDFQFAADLFIIFGKIMETLNIYQNPKSSAASVIYHYQEIVRIACLRKTESPALKEMLEMLAESTLLYFAGRENFSGENKMLKSTIGPIEKTLFYADHRNHTMSFFKMKEYISYSPNISSDKKRQFLNCIEKLTRFEFKIRIILYNLYAFIHSQWKSDVYAFVISLSNQMDQNSKDEIFELTECLVTGLT